MSRVNWKSNKFNNYCSLFINYLFIYLIIIIYFCPTINNILNKNLINIQNGETKKFDSYIF